MRDRIVKLRFTLDRLSLRERLSIFIAAALSLLTLWFFLLAYPQQHLLAATSMQISNVQNQIKSLQQQRKGIETLATDDTQAKLLKKFQQIKQSILVLDKKTKRYEERFLSDGELTQVLYSMLKKVSGVTIVNFSDEEFHEKDPVTVPALNTTNKTNKAQPLPNKPVEKTQYSLTLNGDFFSLLNYLERLEQIPWQLYWDELDYRVSQYPIATLTIQFYTLRPLREPYVKPVS